MNNKNILLYLTKIFFSLLLIYLGWFQDVVFKIPIAGTLIGAVITVCLAFHLFNQKKIPVKTVNFELISWSVFVVFAISAGMYIAVNVDIMLSSMFTFIQFLLLNFIMIYISIYDQKIDYFINLFLFLSMLSALTTVFWGVHYISDRISMSYETNPNTLGLIMVIGIFCVFYNMQTSRKVVTFFLIFLLFAFSYVIILSGSRKAFLSAVIIIILWLILKLKTLLVSRRENVIKGIVTLVLTFIIGIFLFNKFVVDTLLFERLANLFDSGDNTRIEMYKESWLLFKDNPLLGVGMENFREVSSFNRYSHSTYAEMIASTGIIGVILYFFPYITMFSQILKLSRSREKKLKYQSNLILIMFGVILFLGIGVIHIYSIYTFYFFGIILSFIAVNNNNIKKKIFLENFNKEGDENAY